MRVATSLNVLFDSKFELPVKEQLKRVAAAGFRLVDINFWDWGNFLNSPFMGSGWLDWVKEIKSCGEEFGVTFHQAHGMVYKPFEDFPGKEHKIEAAKRAVIGAGMLGIDWVVMHPMDVRGTEYKSSDIPREEQDARNAEWLRPYAELAGEHGTGIALENMNDYGGSKRYCVNAEQLLGLVAAIGLPNVGVCWDIGHAHCQKLDQYAEIMKLGPALKVLHVQDNNGLADQHTAPYYGTVDWKNIKKALDDSSYAGDFTFEAHMLVRMAPDDKCRDLALRLLYSIGENVVRL